MNMTSVARPYAKAAFEVAKKSNQLAMWSLALKQLSLAAQNSEAKNALKDPRYTKQQLSDLFISSTSRLRVLAAFSKIPSLVSIKFVSADF